MDIEEMRAAGIRPRFPNHKQGRWGRSYRAIKLGIWNLYPPCCVLSFALTWWHGYMPGFERGGITKQRWLPREDREKVYVPCGWFHHAPLDLPEPPD